MATSYSKEVVQKYFTEYFMDNEGKEGVVKDLIDALDSLEEDQATSDTDIKEDEPTPVNCEDYEKSYKFTDTEGNE